MIGLFEGCLRLRYLHVIEILFLAFAAISIAVPETRAQTSPDLSNIDRRIKEGERNMLPDAKAVLPELGKVVIPTETVDSFTLSGVVIEGATAMDPGKLAPAYEDLLATTVAGNEIYRILQRITDLYRAEGYFLTRAIAPEQEIIAGVILVRVVEGYIAKFTVAGDTSQDAVLEGYAKAALAERPAKLATVERSLLLMNDLPGITVTPQITPIRSEAGEYDLTVKIVRKTVEASARLDNRGTPEVGRLQGYLSGALNGLHGAGDSIHANFVTVPNQPKELLYGSLSGSLPIGDHGTTGSAFGAYGRVDPGGSTAQLDSDIRIAQFVGTVRHPLIRSRQQNLRIAGLFDFRNFREQQLDNTVISDRLRTLRASTTYDLIDSLNGENLVKLEVSQGLGILGASEEGSSKLSRADGQSQFTKLSGNLARTQHFTRNIALHVSVAGQWSADPLLSYEEFSLGGETYGRGYDYGELSGEHGVAASGELRYGRNLNWPWLSQYQVYGFYDFGAVWNETAANDLTEDHLSSAGAGLRLRVNDHLRAGFEAAKPLDKRVTTTGDRDWRFFFSATANY